MPACKKAGSLIVEPLNGIELIQNPSFELNGHRSYQGWVVYDTLACVVENNNVLPGGGQWSMRIVDAELFPLWVRTTIAPPEGTHPFELSVYAKSDSEHPFVKRPDTLFSDGSVFLYIKRTDTLLLLRSFNITGATWKRYVIRDTISIIKPDSLVVILKGPVADLVSFYTFYDLCNLKQVNW
jgi:hypothetical protein